MFKKLLFATALITAGLVGVSQSQAAPIIQLMVGNTLITDGGMNDGAAAAGVISYIATTSPFSVAINTGVANDTPYLDLSSQDISSTGAGTLVIKFTATNLTTPASLSNFLSMFSGNIAGGSGNVQLQTYYDASNTAFGTATALGNLSSGNSTFGLGATGAAGGSALFSLTEVVTVTANGPGRNFSLDASLSNVPEPMSIALLGSGLVGLGMIRRNRKSV